MTEKRQLRLIATTTLGTSLAGIALVAWLDPGLDGGAFFIITALASVAALATLWPRRKRGRP